MIQARFKDAAESETSQPSRIRLGPLRDESESRVDQLNSEEADSAENRTSLGQLDTMMMILCLIAIQYGNNYISMYLRMCNLLYCACILICLYRRRVYLYFRFIFSVLGDIFWTCDT